jgi:hypothetical protein
MASSSKMSPAMIAALQATNSIPTPRVEIGLTSYTVFSQSTIQNLTDSDFFFDDEMKVRLKNKECMLILFYGEDSDSRELCGIWGSTASQIAGPHFAACNLSAQNKIKLAFVSLYEDPLHPLHEFALSQVPVIIVYRKGLPKAYYNGDLSTSSIADYALTLACHPDYFETTKVGGSMEMETKLAMTLPLAYDAKRTLSGEYRTFDPIHGRSPPVMPVAHTTSALPAPGFVASMPGSKQYGMPIQGKKSQR